MNQAQYLAEFLQWERANPDAPFHDWPGLTRAIRGLAAREVALRAEVETLTADKVRLDWLEAHPLKADVRGGADDGGTGTFWGCGSANCTLRETIDTISSMPPA